MGDRIRAGVQRFVNMGLSQGQNMGGATRPGGLPLFHFMRTAVLPERNLVPLRTRWRDDKLIVYGGIAGVALLLLGVVAAVVFGIIL
jgi:type VI secretion system protein ImpL